MDAIKKKIVKQRRQKPKLRFPEFWNMDDWEVKQLGFVCDMQAGQYVSASDISEQYESGLYPCYGGNGLRGYTKTYTHSGKYPLIGRQGALCGNINLGIGQFYATEHAVVVTSKDGIDVVWLFYNLINLNLNQYATGQAQPGLSVTVLEKVDTAIPASIKEQQKIANCLTSLDELIVTQSEKLDALKVHKKGLLEQLFPAEGETVPQLRFPEFRDAVEWKTKLFANVYQFKFTNSFSREQLNYSDGLVRNIHYGDIHTKFSTLFNIENEMVPFVNSSESLEKIKSENYCVEGDMIFADASEDTEDVGKSIEIVHLNNETVLSGLHTLLARQKEDNLVVGFGGYLFKSRRIRAQIKREAQGTKVYAISAGRLSNIQVCFPSDKQEQRKIADCLSSLDELIATQNQKLNALKVHKKGLMQQLFPSLEEVDK